MEKPVLTAKKLTKDFNGYLAVNDISFEIGKGEIVGLLGPNGAGKTTTIMMLLGITKPTKGKVEIFDLDFEPNREKILNRVNFSSAYTNLARRITVFENLVVFAHLYGIENHHQRISKLLEEFELTELKNILVRNLSSGQMTRLNLCKAFLNNPDILFLDEPTASLDPEIAQKVRELLFKARRERNISILLTSHNMEEVTQLCDRVVILNKGKIIACDTPLNLTKMIKDCLLVVTFDAPLSKVKEFCSNQKLNFQIPQPDILEITTQEEKIGRLLTQLSRGGIDITDITIKKPDLEDVFLKIANQKYELPKN